MIPLKIVYKQLHDLGEFTILSLKDQAKLRGVADVNYLVREGNVREQLRKIILGLCPDMLIKG